MTFTFETASKYLADAMCERGYQPKSWWVSDWANEYGEPGYGNWGTPVTMVVLGSWWIRDDAGELTSVDRRYPRICNRLEELGIELVWHDEWVVDSENSKAYRANADSHGWTPSYVVTDDGQMLTPDDDIDTWLEWATNTPSRCLTRSFIDGDMPALLRERGWVLHADRFETGFHPGQTDRPQTMFDEVRKTHPTDDVLFTLDGVGQFDAQWSVWCKPEPEED